MSNEREAIVDKIESLRLTAEVAAKARADEILGFARRVIADEGLNGKIQLNININAFDEFPSIYIKYAEYNGYGEACIEMHASKDESHEIIPMITIGTLPYDGPIEIGNRQYYLLHAVYAISRKLHALKAIVNSEMFKSCCDDINAYLASEDELKKHDHDAREAKIKAQESNFFAGDTLIDNNGKRHVITKVTGKKLWITNYFYCNGAIKKSIYKHEVATHIVNTTWKISR